MNNNKDRIIFSFTEENLQDEAESYIGRKLTQDEIEYFEDEFLDQPDYIEKVQKILSEIETN